MTKTYFRKKLRAYVYWNTKEDSNETDLQMTIEKWLKKHPEGLVFYLDNPELWFNSFKGATQARKEDLAIVRNEKLTTN